MNQQYEVFRRSCTDWKSFVSARKTHIKGNLSYEQAQKMCDEFNNNRSNAQIKAGTKYEFTAQ